MTKKLWATALAVIMTASLLVGCTGTETPTTAAPAESAQESKTEAPTTADPVTEASTEAPTEPATEAPAEAPTYTYNTYAEALPSNWNPHTWEITGDGDLLELLSTPLVYMQVENTEDSVYQWVYAMAEPSDVTTQYQDDLTRYGCDIGEADPAEITEGYVYQWALNKDACWQDGTPINADTYLYSMQTLLDPKMHNYRAAGYYSGDAEIAGANGYHYGGTIAEKDNGLYMTYIFSDLVQGEDGVYKTPEGNPIYWAVDYPLSRCGDASVKDLYEEYGADFFGTETWDDLVPLMDEKGLVPITDETFKLMSGVLVANPALGQTEDDLYGYMVYMEEMPEVGFDTVGFYKVDDYTINVVYKNPMPSFNEFLYHNKGSLYLVYEGIYEANKDTTGELMTTAYNNAVENTMSYGPYKLESLQTDKQMVLVRNENWWGWEKGEDGTLVSYTPYLVNDEKQQRYQSTKIVIDVMDNDAAKQAFLKGELSDWKPSAEELVNYAASDRLYKAYETETNTFFFNTNPDALKVMDESKGNKNSVVLSNDSFRKAFSLSIDRDEWVTATPGFTPMCGILNDLYFYNFFEDPTSIYRASDAAMQAICNVYGVEYGEGTPYPTLKDAYKSINGYNLTEAKELMAQACKELTEAGLYKKGEEIHIRIGYKAGALDSADNKQMELMNKYINAAAEGSGFGTITLEALGNLSNRYSDVVNGEFAIGYGAWSGAAFASFTMFRVYCDPDYVELDEGACWDPATETLTLTIEGQELTKTWQEWSCSMTGSGDYAAAEPDVKLQVLAGLEENFLLKYYRIPLCTATSCQMMSFKADYITEDYNIAYEWGGFELIRYNYSDAEWAEFLAGQGGTLNYE